jgi:hypothetical protein
MTTNAMNLLVKSLFKKMLDRVGTPEHMTLIAADFQELRKAAEDPAPVPEVWMRQDGPDRGHILLKNGAPSTVLFNGTRGEVENYARELSSVLGVQPMGGW